MNLLKTITTQRVVEASKGTWRLAPLFHIATYSPRASTTKQIRWYTVHKSPALLYNDIRRHKAFLAHPIGHIHLKPFPRSVAIQCCGEAHIKAIEAAGYTFTI